MLLCRFQGGCSLSERFGPVKLRVFSLRLRWYVSQRHEAIRPERISTRTFGTADDLKDAFTHALKDRDGRRIVCADLGAHADLLSVHDAILKVMHSST